MYGPPFYLSSESFPVTPTAARRKPTIIQRLMSPMKCPNCGKTSKVYSQQYTPAGKRRYHCCNHCEHKCVSVDYVVVEPSKQRINAKLNPDDVREMRQLAANGASSMDCALAYDINQKTAWAAITGKTWAFVK